MAVSGAGKGIEQFLAHPPILSHFLLVENQILRVGNTIPVLHNYSYEFYPLIMGKTCPVKWVTPFIRNTFPHLLTQAALSLLYNCWIT